MSSAASRTRILQGDGEHVRGQNRLAEKAGAGPRAGLAPVLTVATVLSFAAFALLASVVMSLIEPQPVPGGVKARQEAETVLYVLTFGALLPVSLWAGPKLSERVARGPNADGLSSLAALLAASFAGAVALVRVLDLVAGSGGFTALLAVMLVWWAAAAAAVTRTLRPSPWEALLRSAALAPTIWAIAAALAFAAVLSVAHFGSVSAVPLLLGAAAIALVLRVARSDRRLPDPGRGWRLAADALVVGALLLAIPDLVVMAPEAPDQSFPERYKALIIAFHQDFLLGPANQVLGGSTMLVDVSSQYGVGSIYALAAWFELLPIGYGTLGLLDGVLTAFYFVLGFLVLRVARVSWALATAALALGVVALVYNRVYPVGSIVQEGPIRFGLPLAVIIMLVLAARAPQRGRLARGIAFAVVGLSSIWSIEMFVYTAGTLAAMLAVDAYLLRHDRLRRLAQQLALAGLACAGAHLLLAAGTLVAAGELPDWGQYLVFLKAFLVGEAGETTYDFERWSPGLAVGAVCLASALALGILLRSRRDLFEAERVAIAALTGTTAYGVLLFSYFVNRSAPHVLVYVCLPVLLAGTLWLGLLLRHAARPRTGALTTGALTFALCLALLMVTGAWPRLGERLGDSALAYAVPGVNSARNALDRLEDFPRLNQRSLEAERLLERNMPGERRSLVLLRPGLDIETLMHSGRSNALPLPDAIQYSFAGSSKLPMLLDSVRELEAGRRILIDQGQLDGLRAYRRDPESLGPITQVPAGGAVTTPLQVRTLAAIDARFRLRPIYRGDEFAVMELEPRP